MKEYSNQGEFHLAMDQPAAKGMSGILKNGETTWVFSGE